MANKKIVLASNNRGKLVELGTMLASLQVELLPIAQFTKHVPEETGTTFLENALIKARHASSVSSLPAIADDSGLEVDALGGAPGVYSARYAGVDADDAANNRKLLQALTEVSADQRTARFRCVLAYVCSADDAAPICVDAVWEGIILPSARGDRGFGYDPVFQPLGLCVSSAELVPEQKNQLSHRGQAMRQLLNALQASR